MYNFLRYGFLLLIFLAACKKDKENKVSKLEFVYNGTSYTLEPGQWNFHAKDPTSLQIFKNANVPFDLFALQKGANGNECGVVIEENCCEFTYNFFDDGSNGCLIDVRDTQGQPLDSSKVYIYEMGTLDYSTTNCSYEQGVDLFTGNTVRVSICDVSGSFNMTAINGTGDQIDVSGNFSQYDVRQ